MRVSAVTRWLLALAGHAPARFSAENVLEIYRFVTYFGLTSMAVSTELLIAELAARGAPRRVFERLLGPNARGIDLEALKTCASPRSCRSSTRRWAARRARARMRSRSRPSARPPAARCLMGEFHLEVGKFPPLFYAAELACADGSYTVRHDHPRLPVVRRGPHRARRLVVHLRPRRQRRLHLRARARGRVPARGQATARSSAAKSAWPSRASPAKPGSFTRAIWASCSAT